MKTAKIKSSTQYTRIGLAATIVSAVIYGLASILDIRDEDFFSIFVCNFSISVIYFFSLLGSGNLKAEKNGLIHFLQALVLLLISAYSLNHSLPVFELSAQWLTVLLIAICSSYSLLGFWDKLPSWLRNVASFLMGIGLILFLYLSIYLIPLYPVSFIGLIALGISIHSFIPLLLFIFTLKWLLLKAKHYPKVRNFFYIGISVSLLIVFAFVLQWNKIDRMVNSKYQHSLIADNTELPSWVKVAEVLPVNGITEKYLKSGLVYTLVNGKESDWFAWGLPSRNFDEIRRHDPLIVIASLVALPNTISTDDKIKILESSFDARHKTQDRLWRGEDLSTTNVISNIRIWPQYRMAYTEQTITVANNDKNERWRNQQEAIYTFHLPEAAVVSSLSLWINGKEEKGILTTKGKAENAYKQIVGVESRDPSVVHWQEGNTVSVRVFPVMANNVRVFKIGITAPLTLESGKLRYESVYFDGPDDAQAKEIVQVDWVEKPADITMDGFTLNANNRFIKEGDYKRKWDLSFKPTELSPKQFRFKQYSYQVKPYQMRFQPNAFDAVYLDVNNAWTKTEFEEVVDALGQKPVYVFDDELIKLNEDNSSDLFKLLHKRRFSLFPFQSIDHPSTALVITKGTISSPNLNDLKGSAFASSLEKWIQRGDHVCVYNLGNTLNPYLKTLKEHRTFYYANGDIALLQQLLRENKFIATQEDEDHIVIDNAGIVLNRKKDSVGSGDAPDHLLRLFAYNHLLQQLNHKIFTNQESDTLLVAIAQEANIVSPLSSLVVLETAADYERFDIKASKNSLQNASMKSKGAVPEPHEWALIIGSFLLIIWLKYKQRLNQFLAKI